MNPLLIAYRLAWIPALWFARAAVTLEQLTGKRLTPVRWRLTERLMVKPENNTRDEHAQQTVWLHAASLGECKGLWAFAKVLQTQLDGRAENHADIVPTRLLLTTNTVSGLEFLRGEILRGTEKTSGAETVITARLAPLDHPRLARRFIMSHNIRALVLFEVELWPHWIAAARRANIPTLWISARLTERARRRYAGNRLYAGAFRRVLRGIEWIQVQREDEEHALRRLGGTARAVETGGDLRGLHYLSPLLPHSAKPTPGEPKPTPYSQSHSLSIVAKRCGLAFVSLHAHELPLLAPHIRKALRTQNPPSPVFVFPRRLEETPLFLAHLASEGFVLHSRLPSAQRVIVDSFGRVGDALQRAHTAVVGGSFGGDDSVSVSIGGHNAWEPFVAGCRIIIGPHHSNQRALVERLEPAGWLHVSQDGALISEIITDAHNRHDGDSETEQRERARAEFLRAEHSYLLKSAQHAAQHIVDHMRKSA